VAIPAAPGNLATFPISRTQVNLAWTDNSANEDGFKIERCAGVTCTNFAQMPLSPQIFRRIQTPASKRTLTTAIESARSMAPATRCIRTSLPAKHRDESLFPSGLVHLQSMAPMLIARARQNL
jgi:hypothetical protein